MAPYSSLFIIVILKFANVNIIAESAPPPPSLRNKLHRKKNVLYNPQNSPFKSISELGNSTFSLTMRHVLKILYS